MKKTKTHRSIAKKVKQSDPQQRLPVIFVFDLDETMIGVSSMIGEAVELNTVLHDATKIGKLPKTKSKYRTHYRDFMTPEMVRPFLGESLKKIKHDFSTAEFFVYSAGTHEYVSDILSWIESYIDITFRRPIFARHNTMVTESSSFVKSLKYQAPVMLDALVKDYPSLKNDKNREEVVNHRMVHIDDREGILWEGSTQLIQCKPYSYRTFFDITEGIDKDILNHPLTQAYLESSSVVYRYSPGSSVDQIKEAYHLFMFEQYHKIADSNKEQLQDEFMKDFAHAVSKYKNLKKPFTEKNVKEINDTLNKEQK